MYPVLKQYIYESYNNTSYNFLKHTKKKPFLQIDDQTDYDNLAEFCNIFINFKKKNFFEVELIGTLPITQEIADLAEIYNGSVDTNTNKITLTINPRQIEAIVDLASLIRKTSTMGDFVGNPSWPNISARTISSLHRFSRVIKEYVAVRQKQLT